MEKVRKEMSVLLVCRISVEPQSSDFGIGAPVVTLYFRFNSDNTRLGKSVP